MRIDKFLKVVRIMKRRTVSKELVDVGRVTINGKTAKPSSEVKVGDLVTIKLVDRRITLKIVDVKTTFKKDEADQAYVILDEEFFKEQPNATKL